MNIPAASFDFPSGERPFFFGFHFVGAFLAFFSFLCFFPPALQVLFGFERVLGEGQPQIHQLLKLYFSGVLTKELGHLSERETGLYGLNNKVSQISITSLISFSIVAMRLACWSATGWASCINLDITLWKASEHKTKSNWIKTRHAVYKVCGLLRLYCRSLWL